MAASLAHVDDRDSWSTHFRDTMVGGRLLNNPRMAELHAREAPDRVRELEAWGAVFDRTRDGRILQRPFGGHTYPRLAHVGDRTGLELIRTLQDRSVAVGVKVYQETIITRLAVGPAGVLGAIGYRRADGVPVAFPARAVILATGGAGRAFAVTSNSWECSGDGYALAWRAGAELIDMEFVQFHPTGMVHPARRARPARHGGRARRGRHPAQRRWRALHVALPAGGPPPRVRRHGRGGAGLGGRPHGGPPDRPSPPAGAVHARQRGARHLHRGQGRPRLTRTAASSWTSATCRRSGCGASCPRCTSSSRSSPTWTSRPGRWRSARRCTT